MAKTIQEQYNQINKGKGSKELFLKEVKRNYPHMIVNSATFKQAEEILLNRSVITENLAGIVNPTSNKNWFQIFNDNMNVIKEETAAAKKDEAIKAEVKEPNKDVVELEVKGYDYKDDKNINNLSGEQVRLGLKFEMDKVRETVSDADLGDAIKKAQDLVVKNLSSDPLYYVKNAAFGIEGIGYTDEAPGITASKSDKMEKVKLKEGDSFTFTTDKCEGDSEKAYMTYQNFPKDVKAGEHILVDDGKLLFEVISSNGKNEVKTTVLRGGKLKSKKGVNLPNTKISLPALTEKDIKDALFAIKMEVDWLALSFVRNAEDLIKLNELIKENSLIEYQL